MIRGHGISFWSCNVCWCISWYKICHLVEISTDPGGKYIYFRYCDVCCFIAWYKMCHWDGNSNLSGRKTFLFGIAMFVGASHDIKSSPPLPFPPWWTLYWLYYYFFSLIYPGYSDVMVCLFLHYHLHSSSAGFSLILSVYTHNINSWSACGSVECLYYPFKKVSLEHMAQQWFVQNLLTQFEQSWWKYACATPVVAAYHHFEICSNNFRGFLTSRGF